MSAGAGTEKTPAPSTPAGFGARAVQELAVRAMGGDESAQRALHGRLIGPINGLFVKCVGADAQAAELLAHQTVSEALQRLTDGSYVPERAWFLTFVYGVAQKVKLRYLKERRRNKEQPLSSLDGTGEQADSPILVESESLPPFDEIEAMRSCLFSEETENSLTAEERFVVIGRSDSKTFEVLAKELGRSLDTVYRRQMSGLDKLRKCMEAKGFS